jgi:hypothetical protein
MPLVFDPLKLQTAQPPPAEAPPAAAPAAKTFDPAQLPGNQPSRMSQIASTLMDIVNSGGRGLRYGLEGLGGLGGNIYGLESAAADKIAGWAGVNPWARAGMNRELKEGQSQYLPTSQDVQEQVTNPILGEPGAPSTYAGHLAETATSMLPGLGEAGLMRGVIAPTIGMELGGEAGKALGSETLGRVAGGFGGALTPGTVSRAITGPALPAARAGFVKTMMTEGVPITAGQATGRKALQYAEVGPFEGRAANIQRPQSSAFTKAALRRAGINADEASPEVMAAAQEDFGRQYDSLLARTNGLPLDPQLEHDLLDNVMQYERLKDTGAAPAVNEYFTRLSNAARDNGGVIPTDVFQSIRSDIAADLKAMRGDPGSAQTVRSLERFQQSLYDSIGRSSSPEVVAQWRTVNNNYRNFKTLEKAMGGAGNMTAEGYITPGKLRSAVEQGDRTGYVQGRGDFNDLARAGEGTMKDLPQSGTFGRAAPFVWGGAAVEAGHRLMNSDALGAAATLAAPAAPWVLAKALTSGPIRRTLLRNVSGQGPPMLDPMTAALLARQASGREKQ